MYLDRQEADSQKISYIEELLEASLKCNFICLYWLTSGGPFKRVVKIVCHYVRFLRFCRGFKAAFAGQRRIIQYVNIKLKASLRLQHHTKEVSSTTGLRNCRSDVHLQRKSSIFIKNHKFVLIPCVLTFVNRLYFLKWELQRCFGSFFKARVQNPILFEVIDKMQF